ncbi:MAG: hypothetical protein UV63_C0033G0023 [Microgenomates group bacterium GW2011_GWC1_43_11]|uniref:Uncharacterized protein n=2 Tax=Candidatus Gottesmaniibacteriota TaxID=1752720 RepID=A0A0G1INX1_9BACT|nr:MAG: hypothetical protein UV63_C0033G0023 [Microgenomates group bacterium GW2011_GWC1_43_11]KKT38128.1 MAG: hypothetical protein UW22_C0013G0015 [Candidatus Gottesmanbacteria bacterium GW2011_GWB1_44_11c]KKT60855.1 MAG: hypothetical protein UW52_C0016G0002 [Candidatus Gottesmanbacteria bacterium GW2011_GWA1_44_24b]HCM82390.1 hypothetical protein [Patescibacteria group bacterium]
MASPSVAQSAKTKNVPIEPSQMIPPKQPFPVWVIFLLLFLVSIIVGMGTYIGFQQGMFRKKTTIVTPTNSPTPISTTMITPGADWKTFRDEKAGLTLKYPPTVLLNGDGKGRAQPILSVSVESVDSIPEELPLSKGRKEALADKEALEKGVAQTIGDFAASDALVRIGNTYNGRLTSTLSRFEVCSVIFSRSLVFYPDTYRVIIGLSGNNEHIMSDMPEFFTTDTANCSDQNVWNRDMMGTFIPTLAKGQGKGAGQEWYDTFTAIVKTITLNSPIQNTASSSPSTTPSSLCEVSDSAFCNALTDIKSAMEGKNYTGINTYETITSVICDPEGMAIAICEGSAKGVVKEGYSMGYNQSEGTIQTKDQHLASIASYVTQNGPFIYKGSLQSGDKGMIVSLTADASKLFVLYMKRIDSSWRITTVLVGGAWGDEEFINLKPTLLDRVQ